MLLSSFAAVSILTVRIHYNRTTLTVGNFGRPTSRKGEPTLGSFVSRFAITLRSSSSVSRVNHIATNGIVLIFIYNFCIAAH